MQLRDHLLGRAGEWMFAKTTPKRFLEHLESHLRTVAPGRESDLVSRIRARAGEVADADADLVSDKASEGLLVTSATVLAAFEELEPGIGDRARTIAFLQHVFVESIEHTSSLSTRLLFRSGRDPAQTIEKFMTELTGLYGESFAFEFERGTRTAPRSSRCG